MLFFVAEAFTGTPFHLSILTPEQVVFDGDVEYVEAPGSERYFGVLAHYAAMVKALASGTLKVRYTDCKVERWQVDGGFFEVSANRATVLADTVGGAKA